MKRISAVLFLFCAGAFCVPNYVHAQAAGNEFFRQEGIASWYGSEFDGRPTASGEIFNSSFFTAAHPTLPFGTMLVVTNRHNDKRVTVRINDRGPFVSARIIDVSKAAAEELDMLITGTAPVLIESVDRIVAHSPARPETNDPFWLLPPAASAPEPVKSAAPAVHSPPAQPPADTPAYIPPLAYPPPAATPPAFTPQPSYAPPATTYAPPPVFAPPAAAPPPPAYAPQPSYVPAYTPPAAAPPVYTPPPAAFIPPSAYIPPVAPAAQAVPRYEHSPVVLIPAINPAPNKVYRLQVGSFKVARNAIEAAEKLTKAGLSPKYEPSGEYYRVVVAGIPGNDVQLVTERIGSAGFREVLIREEH